MENTEYDAIIIGAGHNGLVTATYLAKEGLDVLVLERLDRVGGAVTTDEFSPGFMGPMCSYVSHVLQGKVVDDLELRKHGLDFAYSRKESDSSRKIHLFPDGTFIGGPGNTDKFSLAKQLSSFNEKDAQAYFRWDSFWDEAASILYPYFLTEPPTIADLMQTVKGTSRETVLEKLLTWSYIDLIEDHFQDDRIKAYVMDSNVECDPESPGSMLGAALFACSRFSRDSDRGIPKMSMGNISEAIEDSAKSSGVEIRTRALVEKVIVEGGSAKGVRLANGEEIRSFIVASNADPKRTFKTMFQAEELDEDTLKRMDSWKTTAGCVKFLAAMNELPDLTGYLGSSYDANSIINIKIMPSVEYHKQSWRDAANGKVSSCPVMNIQIPSTVEPNLVKGKGHVMSNWVLFEPPTLKDSTWEAERENVGEQIIDVISQYAPNFRTSLVDWTVQTPEDIESRVGMTDGNIRHLDMIPSQLLSQRQPYRTSIDNFYMCGAGTHPMGEVTGAPGHNAANAILKDLERKAI